MPRQKKEAPKRKDKRYEIKKEVGRKLDGSADRKSFYSRISKDDAYNQADDYINEKKIAEALGTGFVTKDINFKEWAYKWLKSYKLGTVKDNTYSETYLYTVENHLIPFFGKTNLKSINPIDIKNFFNQMSEKYYETTLKKMRLCLFAIFDTAIDNNLLIKNPAKNIDITVKLKSIVKDTYTKNEVDKILKFAKTHKYGLVIYIFLVLGLRRSEIVGLKWSDVNFKNKTISINRAATIVNGKVSVGVPKTKTSIRTLPLDKDMIDMLKSAYTKDDDFIIGINGKVMSPDNLIRHRYEPFIQDLLNYDNTLKRLNPHQMRHTCGTLLYQKTKNIYAVSKYLGHSDVLITTKIYIHNNPETLRKDLKMK
jgi:integrase